MIIVKCKRVRWSERTSASLKFSEPGKSLIAIAVDFIHPARKSDLSSLSRDLTCMNKKERVGPKRVRKRRKVRKRKVSKDKSK